MDHHDGDGRLPVTALSGFLATGRLSVADCVSSGREDTTSRRDVNRKIEAARSKRALGEELTEYEWRVVQYVLGGACSTCGKRR